MQIRALALASLVLFLTSCSAGDATDITSASPRGEATNEVVVVTHDSFMIPDDVLTQFEEDSGLDVTFVGAGDTGTLVNRLILTKSAPLGDVAFGVDNTFASRALEEDLFISYESNSDAADDSERYAVENDFRLTAIDVSDVCINADLTFFDKAGLSIPASLEDLLKPEYGGLLSVPDPATSSPGLAFLMATVAAMGDEWPQYWKSLEGNGLRVTSSWSESYYTDFSAPNYGGDYPLVVSYASSPPFEVIDGEATTVALLDTCFRQVEYAGVLAGAKNPEGAKKVIDWMLSDGFQAAVPESMYVYPVSSRVSIPEDWTALAPLASDPWSLEPQEISTGRERWISQWTEIVRE